MSKVLSCSFLIWLCFMSPAFAGTITNIDVVKNNKSCVETLIRGEYKSYQAIMAQSPCRFVVDISDSTLTKNIPGKIRIKGPVVSHIVTGKNNDNGVRIVFYSARPDTPFHANIQDKDGGLLVRCWEENEKKTISSQKKPKNEKNRPISIHSNPLSLKEKKLEDIIGKPQQIKGKEKSSKNDRLKLSTYSSKKVTLDFYKTDIHNVFRILAEVSGKNIIVDQDVKGELTMSLKDVPWDFAMELILEVEKLKKDERLNTIIISPMPEKKGEKGVLLVRKVSNEVILPAKRLKKREENRQKAENMILKASALEAKGNKKEALQLYENAVRLWNDNIDLLKKAGYLHYLLGNFSKSYYFSRKALKLNTSDADAALYAALAASRLGKDAEANTLFKAAVKGEPKIPEAYYNYALFLERQKRYGDAISYYKRDEDIFGPSLELSLRIARLYEKMGNKKAACDEYKLILVSGFNIDEETLHKIKIKTKALCQR